MAASRYVFDVTAMTFQTEVAERSLDVPVLLDFWADWCEPCKSFTPILEKVADEFGGAFLVGKVNAEEEAELGQAFQVQNIPYGVLLSKGRPVDAFTGVLSIEQVRALLKKHGIEPLESADSESDEPVNPDSPAVRLAEAREAVCQGHVEVARAALAAVCEEETDLATERANLDAGLVFLEAELAESPAASACLAAARTQFLAGEFDASMRSVLASAREDRGFGDGMARRAIRLVQGTLGDTDEVDEYRRQLATLLY